MDDPPKVDPDEVLEKLRATPLGPSLETETARRSFLYGQLERSADPMLREMGQELSSGRTSPLALLHSDAYGAHLLSVAEQADGAALKTGLDQYVADHTPPPAPRWEDEEDDDFSEEDWLR
ncbi:hypothetical protein [Saccharopolyspora cebuensis]|uniref:Uncharacterized protein n=1 Tax=Saccharopolyspora cebuensis TaxID=418759 RepID=A0ABV4CQP5_9PSEU